MDRKAFLIWSSRMFAAAGLTASGLKLSPLRASAADDAGSIGETSDLTLFLCGDVMTGRGIDQILPHPVSPELQESHVRNAKTYVMLAEKVNGPIRRGVSADYVWGDALHELEFVRPDVRIVNLETSVTTSSSFWPGKGIHYRMHPDNVDVLLALGTDICVLGNNHAMDFGRAGLEETLRVLSQAGLLTSGAGMERRDAAAPAVIETTSGRLLVFSYASPSAGVPSAWRAKRNQSGVNYLADLGRRSAARVIADVESLRKEGDRIVVSLHWGANWGYRIPSSERTFAHRLVDAHVADVVYGHSSHHPKGIEIYRNRPILYGCGDLLNDYEGISGQESFRGELTLMYFVRLDDSGRLVSLEMTPMHIARFRLNRATMDEAKWLASTLDRESTKLGARVELTDEFRLRLQWR